VIKNPNDIVEELIADYLKIFGDNLLSSIMYGSAVSHEYRPGKSDINLVFILTDNSIEKLVLSIPVQRKWNRRGVAYPLFMTKEYIARSLDNFPIEFLDMQTSYRVLYGNDPVGGLKIELQYLRLQCERELKGITLKLRSAYTEASGDMRKLEVLLEAAMRRLLPVFKAQLVLNNRKIPSGKSEIIAAVEDIYGFGASVFSEVFHSARKKIQASETELFNSFVNQIDKMITFVDTHSTGGTV